MKRISFWDEDPTRLERATKWWKDGVTAKDIAERLGCTKNAVIGKMHRVGLGNIQVIDTESGKLLPRDAVRASRRDMNVTKEKAAAAKKLAHKPPAPLERKPQPAEQRLTNHEQTAKPIKNIMPSKFLGVTLLDLEPYHCRFPVGEGENIRFCGQRRLETSSYCKECREVCIYEEERYGSRRVFAARTPR